VTHKANYRTSLLLASMLLNGCVPYVSSYPKIEVADAIYLHSGCQSELGPHSMVYYPFHGIHISIDMYGSRLGLHIASGTVVELNGKTLKIDGLIGTTPYQATPNLKAFSHASFGVGYAPAWFMESIDRYTTPDNFGPLEGGGNGKYLLWYLYLFVKPDGSRELFLLPKGLTEGSIEIPAMTINGQRYESQKLTFKRESFIGVAAVNC
jgi:hypothetical protein